MKCPKCDVQLVIIHAVTKDKQCPVCGLIVRTYGNEPKEMDRQYDAIDGTWVPGRDYASPHR